MLMPSNFEDVHFLNTSDHWSIDDFKKIRPLPVFSDEVVAYLNSLSRELYKNTNLKHFPDVATFAFYCRRANIAQLKGKYLIGDYIKLGRGIVFHISPSNVPVNFAYSFLVGLLTGNSNIVRVPSKSFEQVDMIVNAINLLNKQNKFSKVASRVVLVKYKRSHNATDIFSSICDIRVIWGGDATIQRIRKKPLPPKAFDVTFSDRYSMCIVNADVYARDGKFDEVARNFYNDTYLFDQNACTSPHLIVWTGTRENVNKSQEVFWNALQKILEREYGINPVLSIDKITNFCCQAVLTDGVKNIHNKDNLLWRVALSKLNIHVNKFCCSGGYFSEYHAADLLELAPIINRKYQTVAYYGFEQKELIQLIDKLQPFGIDRIVPIGRTMDFGLIWDGYNLIETLSRKIDVL